VVPPPPPTPHLPTFRRIWTNPKTGPWDKWGGRVPPVPSVATPLHQSNVDRQRDTKAPCGYYSRKQVWQVETGFFLEPVTSAGPEANE